MAPVFSALMNILTIFIEFYLFTYVVTKVSPVCDLFVRYIDIEKNNITLPCF